MSDFLKETFRPYTKEEQAALSRYHVQRFIVALITLAVVAVIAMFAFLSKAITYTPYQGTWVAEEDLADGFHSSDSYLEFKQGTVFRSGDWLGTMRSANGKQYITVNAPVGPIDWSLRVNDDTLKVEYTVPAHSLVASYQYGQTIYPPQISDKDRQRQLTYIRISQKTDLTREERDELY